MTEALQTLAARLRDERTPISGHVVAEPAGRFADSDVLEAVREGYLLHFGEPRLLAGHDDDLALLAGDYLYALGIQRLAELGDLASVARLADLIATSARLHAEGREADVDPLWADASEGMADAMPPSQ